jgi:hypothetical protein
MSYYSLDHSRPLLAFAFLPSFHLHSPAPVTVVVVRRCHRPPPSPSAAARRPLITARRIPAPAPVRAHSPSHHRLRPRCRHRLPPRCRLRPRRRHHHSAALQLDRAPSAPHCVIRTPCIAITPSPRPPSAAHAQPSPSRVFVSVR